MTDSTTKTTEPLETWCILELMGHVRVVGRLSEEEHFGIKLGRIDVPKGDGPDDYTTQFFGGSSVYRITPTDEETAREMAGYRPRRIGYYSRPAPPPVPDEPPDDLDDAADDGGDDERF